MLNRANDVVWDAIPKKPWWYIDDDDDDDDAWIPLRLRRKSVCNPFDIFSLCASVRCDRSFVREVWSAR